MKGVKVDIVRFVNASQPGFVDCRLADANGNEHIFIDKVPVVSLEDLDANSDYPRQGIIGCELINEENGLVQISTERPWGIDSTNGKYLFTVPTKLIVEF